MNTQKIAIAGVGMVGGALSRYFASKDMDTIVLYDPPQGLGDIASLNAADVVFICVPTPFDDEKNTFDTRYIDEVFAVLASGKIVVIKSTVVPGTTDMYQKKFPQHKIVFNPEFLTEATADEDMQHPHRQIIGYTDSSKDIADDVMQLLPRAPYEKIMRAPEAEMIKYFSNCFYALKVAYVNQVYDLCEKMGIDYDIVKESAKMEPMMGTNHFEIFHKGYRGYGGKCLPKDVKALVELARLHQVNISLLEDAEAYNDSIRL